MSTPIIPWMGGKRRLADRLIPLFPPHECYVEVFAGGAALYFMRPQAAPVGVLNDINGDFVTFYRVAHAVRVANAQCYDQLRRQLGVGAARHQVSGGATANVTY